jgi:hypothetical protein
LALVGGGRWLWVGPIFFITPPPPPLCERACARYFLFAALAVHVLRGGMHGGILCHAPVMALTRRQGALTTCSFLAHVHAEVRGRVDARARAWKPADAVADAGTTRMTASFTVRARGARGATAVCARGNVALPSFLAGGVLHVAITGRRRGGLAGSAPHIRGDGVVSSMHSGDRWLRRFRVARLHVCHKYRYILHLYLYLWYLYLYMYLYLYHTSVVFSCCACFFTVRTFGSGVRHGAPLLVHADARGTLHADAVSARGAADSDKRTVRAGAAPGVHLDGRHVRAARDAQHRCGYTLTA